VETGQLIRQAIAATAEYKLRRGGGGGTHPCGGAAFLSGSGIGDPEELEKNLFCTYSYAAFLIFLIFPIFGLFHIRTRCICNSRPVNSAYFM
jgi:hypothetical protein